MSKPVASKKDYSALVTAKFGPGMLLQHDDLEQLNTYTRDLSRLMVRSFFGCGVVCGLVVSTEGNCGKVDIIVTAGLALDCNGDPIYVPKDVKFALDENCDPTLTGPFWVIMCGTRKCCSPRSAACDSSDDDAAMVCTRE